MVPSAFGTVEPRVSPIDLKVQPKVSFVVIAHNEQAGISRTLKSILGQKAEGNPVEVVVVDDGSTDETPDIVRSFASGHPEVRLVRLDVNRGRGAARATGIAECSGQVVAMVDADIVLPPEWLSRCLEGLESADAVAGTAVPDGDVTYLYNRFRLAPKVRAAATDVAGSNSLYRRTLFEWVEFDDRLKEGEDVALSQALRRTRARVRTIPGLVVRHEESKSLATSLRWMYQSGLGASRQLYRYREVRRPDVVFAGFLLVCGLAWSRRRGGIRVTALPVAYLAAAATAHLNGAFVFEPRRAPAFAGAAGLNMVMLGCYFAGRMVGTLSYAVGA